MAHKKGTPGTNVRGKGYSTTVSPIKSRKEIETIKKLLADNPRDLCLFTLGINTNLRTSDLLQITVGMVRNLKPMDEIGLTETKTGKPRRISLNENCIDAIQNLLKGKDRKDDEPLFVGQRGVLTVPTVSKMVKEWCDSINLKDGNYAAHTLRKTWGYHQRVTFGKDISVLMECYNHSTQRQTQTYLCIQPEEITSVYANKL